MSSTVVVPRSASIRRARFRGVGAAIAALLISVAIPFMVIWRPTGSAAVFRVVPPGVLSLLLASALVIVSHAAVVEWRAFDVDRTSTTRPLVGWLLTGSAFLLGLPCALASAFFEVLANTPPRCPGPVPAPGGIDEATLSPADATLLERCEQATPAEIAGLVTWTVVIAATAALLIAGLVMARRSRIVGCVAVPTAVAGCVIAFDLGHLVTLSLR